MVLLIPAAPAASRVAVTDPAPRLAGWYVLGLGWPDAGARPDCLLALLDRVRRDHLWHVRLLREKPTARVTSALGYLLPASGRNQGISARVRGSVDSMPGMVDNVALQHGRYRKGSTDGGS
jgi:hypothetical protein